MAKIKALRVVSRRPGFRRAGLTHPPHAVLHPLENLSEAQIAALKAEPMLVVQEAEVEEDEAKTSEAPEKPSAPKGGARKPAAPVKGKPAPVKPALAKPAPAAPAPADPPPEGSGVTKD